MAASKKKRHISGNENAENMDASSDSEGSMEESETEDLQNAEVKVDFEAVTPDDSDFSGIRRLLSQLFVKAQIDLTELTDLVLKQNYVSSVVKQSEIPEDEDGEDDDEVFGVVSVVNMSEKKDVNCVKQLKQLLCEANKANAATEVQEKFSAILDNPENNVGFLINERFINIPPQIALPLYESLNKDLIEARAKKMPFHFSHYLLLCKLFKDEESSQPSPNFLIYANAEEELLAEESEVQFDFSLAGENDSALEGQWKEGDRELKPYRRVLLIPCSRWEKVMEKLKDELSIN